MQFFDIYEDLTIISNEKRADLISAKWSNPNLSFFMEMQQN